MWTLSWGMALTSWMEPDFTTVSRRWVWPPGPAATGGAAVATPPPAGSAVATAVPPPSPLLAAPPLRAALARSSRWAGMRLSPPPSAPPDAGASAGVSDVAAFCRAASARLRRCSGISVMSPSPTGDR